MRDRVGVAWGGAQTAWLILLVSVAIVAMLAAPNAALAVDSSISGLVVCAGTSEPVGGIWVTAYRYVPGDGMDSGWMWQQTTSTDATGGYTLSGLVDGTYRIGFQSDGSGQYLGEYYQDSATLEGATDIALPPATNVHGIDATLQVAGRISGNVREYGVALPIEGMIATAYRWNEAMQYWSTASSAFTDASGNYSIGNLGTGIYRVGVSDPNAYWATTYYAPLSSGVFHIEDAADVSVTVGATTAVIDISPFEGSRISGTLLGPDGQPLANAQVGADLLYGEPGTWSGFGRTVYCSADGTYSIGGLAPGQYRVHFMDNTGNYDGEWYDDVPAIAEGDEAAAQIISLGMWQNLAGIDALLGDHQEPTVTTTASGRVTDEFGNPLAGIIVWSQSRALVGEGMYDWFGGMDTVTDGNGNWSMTETYGGGGYGDVINETYFSFHDPYGSYATEFYNNQPFRETATEVPLPVNGSVTGIDAQLSQAGHISGTVTMDGLPAVNVAAWAYRNDGTGWYPYESSEVTSIGAYFIDGLPEGTYRVSFDRAWDDVPFSALPEFYADASDVESATDIAVSAGQFISNIDADLSPGGSISGIVTGGENPLPDVYVEAYRYNADMAEWWCVAGEMTDGSGAYSFDGLTSGAYRVGFLDDMSGTYVGEYYDNAVNLGSATDVTVVEGSATTGIDADLAIGGSISGTVLDEQGLPAEGAMVSAFRYDELGATWQYVSGAGVDPDGSFSVGRLPTGTYRLELVGMEDNFISEFFRDATDIESAIDVLVTAGNDTPGIDAVVKRTGHIQGTVTLQGSPIDDFWLTAWRWEPTENRWVIEDAPCYQFASGGYRISGLLEGTYRLTCMDNTGAGATGYYGGTDLGTAANIIVGPGDVIDPVNLDLAPAAHINGTVRDGMGDPIESVDVVALRWDSGLQSWDAAWSGLTGLDGAYQIAGLPSGSYRVWFGDEAGAWGPEFYGEISAADFEGAIASATPVAVTAGGSVYGIDVMLGSPGAENLAPNGLADAYLTSEDEALLVPAAGVLANDTDDMGVLTAQLVGDVSHGSLVLDASGAFIYTPDSDWYGTDTFTYVASDGLRLSAPVTVSLSVASVNDAPVGAADSYSFEGTLSVSPPGLLANDVDADGDTLRSVMATGAAHGFVDMAEDGSFFYIPWTDQPDAFYYFITDGQAMGDPVRVALNPAADVDETAPVTSITGVPEGWSRSDATVYLAATDSLSGVASTYYTINGGAPQLYVAPISSFPDGTTTITYWSTDVAGNVEAARTAAVLIDRAAPVTGNDAQPTYDSTATVHLGATDAAGVNATFWRLDGASLWTTDTPSPTITVVEPGMHTLEYRSLDLAGNLEEPKSVSFSVGMGYVTFADPNLEAAVRAALGVWAPTPLTSLDMQRLTFLQAPSSAITSLSGLETAVNLEFLQVYDNHITDLTPISGLRNLAWLGIAGNQVSDISPLSSMTQLQTLWIGNRVSPDGVAPAMDLGNNVSNVSALAPLTGLQALGLSNNPITDMSVVSGLTDLRYLSISGLGLNDLEFVRPLTALEQVSLVRNNISDLSPLVGKPIFSLQASTNRISDLSPLVGLPLTNVNLRDNLITDISALQMNPSLTTGGIVQIQGNYLSLGEQDMQDIGDLQARGVSVTYEPQSSLAAAISVAPAAPDGANGWYCTQPRITITHPTVAGQQVYYGIDDEPLSIYTAPVALPDGTHTFNWMRWNQIEGTCTPSATEFRFDGTAPSAPAGFVVSSVSTTGFKVSWAASADAMSGVASYRVYRDGTLVTSGINPWAAIDHLAPDTTSVIGVEAVDEAGNVSARGTVSATTASSGQGVSEIPSGSDVVVPLPLLPGGSLDFGNVIAPGPVHVTPIVPRSEPSDSNFRIVHGAYYDIHVEASFAGPVTITLPYDETQLSGWQSANPDQREAIEKSLKLKHKKADGGWEDITISVDTAANTITGETTSFSDFWIEEPEGSGNWVQVSADALTPLGGWVAVLAVTGWVLVRRRGALPA